MTLRARIDAALRERSAWIYALVVAVISLGPTLLALHAQTFAILGRDQGIFMYVAWALRHGAKVYRDIHEINGPLPHAYYALMQVLGGEDEHVFRVLDTTWLVLAYVLASSTLPRWVGAPGDRRTRVVWSLAGLAVLGSQYCRYDWWHTAQREALYAMLIFGSLALQAVVQTTATRRNALVAAFFASVLGTLPWLGKPPCAMFSLLQLIVLLWDRRSLRVPLRDVVIAACAGGLVVLTVMLGFAFAFEDVRAGMTLLAKVPKLHHTIWNETLVGAYHAYGNAPRLDWAFALSAVFGVAYLVFELPRRAMLALVLPVGGFVVFAGQGKAFPYHLHMLTLGTSLLALVVLAGAATATGGRLRAWLPFVALVAAVLLAAQTTQDALLSPGVRGGWARLGSTAEARATRAYRAHFPWGDYSSADLHDAGAFLERTLAPADTVQTYAFDPYVLFLARRKSASPVIYNFELNVDAALEGGPGARPTPELKTWLEHYRDDAEALVLARLEEAPSAAFVIVDREPFTHPEDGEADFEEHCPRLWRFLTERYSRARVFGVVKVWLRADLAGKAP